MIQQNANGIKHPSTNGFNHHDDSQPEKLRGTNNVIAATVDVDATMLMVKDNTGTTATTNPGVKLLLTHLDHVTPDVRPFITGREFLR